MSVADLPKLNASLNALATVFIALGWWFITHERKRAHIACMISALVASTVFLGTYVLHKILVHGVHTKFGGDGVWVPIYYILLISHLVLAMVIVPMVIMTVIPALRARFDRHRRIGRWTMPVWLYVSVTGVLVYFMLYEWFPHTRG